MHKTLHKTHSRVIKRKSDKLIKKSTVYVLLSLNFVIEVHNILVKQSHRKSQLNKNKNKTGFLLFFIILVRRLKSLSRSTRIRVDPMSRGAFTERMFRYLQRPWRKAIGQCCRPCGGHSGQLTGQLQASSELQANGH